MIESLNKQIEVNKKELEVSAANGDADAQHHLFILLFAEAMEKCDVDLFKRAEKYLIQSAGNGWPDAIEALNDFKILKYGFEQRVARKKGV